LLSKPGYFGFLALDDGAPVGYLVAEVIRRPESPRHLAHELIYIHQISVRPTARRNGAGTLLLNAAKTHGLSLGISLVALDTWSFNESALRFFHQNGLVPYNVRLWNKIG
jgi:GNAT superfamily N-acetyltransferase